jgi:tetrapyrrole methylase family protein / MazG family protein
MNAGTVHIVGLGPGRASLLTGETRALLDSGKPVILRTRRHPTVAELDPAGAWESCDALYAGGQSFESVYAAVVERVKAVAAAGDVVYAVPGHPLVAEATVVLLLEGAAAGGAPVRVYPAVSYADVAATALGVDLGTVQLCDALDLRVDPRRPALISQVFDRDVGSAVKLALLDLYPASHVVTVLRALGTAGESVTLAALTELDHGPSSYLDAVYVPAITEVEDVRRLDGLAAIVARLHAPDGCPWDREQTHASLRPHLLEESYEVLEAIDGGEPGELAEELGDLLLQVLMHAEVGARAGTFGLADVCEEIAAKLIRRHPHVFADGTAKTADEVYQNWDALKAKEKTRSSILEGVPLDLPALAASETVQGRARRFGFEWPEMEGHLEKLREEIAEFAAARNAAEKEDEFGDILFVVAGIAGRLGIEAEQALRGANRKFRERFNRLEQMVAGREDGLRTMPIEEKLALWERAKQADGG